MFVKNIYVKMKVVSLISAILVILPGISHQSECGKRLGKGAVICTVGIHGNAGDFDYSLCTHASLVVHNIQCENEACYPLDDSDFETLYEWVQPHSSTKMGLLVSFDSNFKDYLSKRLRRLNTAKSFLKFMTERNLTFIEFEGAKDKNAVDFVVEIAKAMHERDWHIGLIVNVGFDEFSPNYNFEALSNYVDWFSFSTHKGVIVLEDMKMWPFAPLTATIRDPVGTTKYWVEKALRDLDPQCVVLIVDIMGVKYIAEDNVAEPGPGSNALRRINSVFLVKLCYKLLMDPLCQEHWDEESTTPWAACGTDFYSYDNFRSAKAKTDLAREYNLAGMSIYLDRKNICEGRNPILLVNALQGIRNTTSTKLKTYR